MKSTKKKKKKTRKDNLQSKLKSITQNKIYTDLKENSNLVYTYKVIAE